MSEKPDKTGKGVRFGCGARFGFTLGFYLIGAGLNSWSFFATIIVASWTPLILGCLSIKYGDYLWERLSDSITAALV